MANLVSEHANPDAGPAPEIFVVDSHRVSCDGGGGALGHPRVWLEIGQNDFVECGYCDRRFVLRGHDAHGTSDTRD